VIRNTHALARESIAHRIILQRTRGARRLDLFDLGKRLCSTLREAASKADQTGSNVQWLKPGLSLDIF
jgi:hypothetical protein